MVHTSFMQLSHEMGIYYYPKRHYQDNKILRKRRLWLLGANLSSHARQKDALSLCLLSKGRGPIHSLSSGQNIFICRSFLVPSGGKEASILKTAAAVLKRSCGTLKESTLALKLIPAIGLVAFAAWGLGPLLRLFRVIFLQKPDSSWKKSSTHYILISYLQPLLVWTGVTLVCRVLDPIVLPTEASQAVKQRLLNFVRSLSTVMAFAYCLSSLIQQTQKFFMETNDASDARNMGFSFAGKAIYTAVWVAAISLFMELLGFSTQKWLTAGSLGTVLLTLAGREIFTNFLSGVMIHATRPFVVNEWIQTKIEGYEVSGTVEHVGWWSPTIIRGDDREAVHIPNHKFTVSVVRNLSQKTHWRIKTHLAISHLDVHKINSIVADMRKVLAKNPQVEQQKLHRRVFLENINPENQALMILISCFVKTSHFEEYSCVKEAILLDLLRVISHHRARLATPIRTVQKVYSDPDLENGPFGDSVFTCSGAAANRFLLIEPPSYKVNSDDNKSKVSNRSSRPNEEKDVKVEANSASESRENAKDGSLVNVDPKGDDKIEAALTSNSSNKVPATSMSDHQTNNVSFGDPGQTSVMQQFEKDGMANVLNETLRTNVNPTAGEETLKGPAVASLKIGNGNAEDSTDTQMKMDGKRPTGSPSFTRPSLEENIVLGVALEGSKRTLPIEEDTVSSAVTAEQKELATQLKASGSPSKDKKDDHQPTSS